MYLLSNKCFHLEMEECSCESGSSTVLAPSCTSIIMLLFRIHTRSLWTLLALTISILKSSLETLCKRLLSRNLCEVDWFAITALELWKLKEELKFRSFQYRSQQGMIFKDHFGEAENYSKVLNLLKPMFLDCLHNLGL